MTVAALSNVNSFTGNGSSTTYNTSFIFFSNSHIYVYINQVLKTVNVDYTISGGNGSTGTITFIVAPINGSKIIIKRLVPFEQQSDFESFDGNPAPVTERQFDLDVMQAQQLDNETQRAILLPLGSVGVSVDLPNPQANKALVWNDNGNALTNTTLDIDTHTTSAQASATQAASLLGTLQGLLASSQTSINISNSYVDATEEASQQAAIYAASLNYPTLAPGNAGSIVRVNSGSNGYDVVTRVSFLDGATVGNQGDMLYRSSTDWVRLPIGSNGQFLGITSGLPTWNSLPNATTTNAGIVQFATNDEFKLGSSTSKVVAPSTFKNALGLCNAGSVNGAAITAGSLINITTPGTFNTLIASIFLICETSDLNYSVNDVVYFGAIGGGGAENSSAMSLYKTSTGAAIRISTGGIVLNNKTSGANETITNSRWTMTAYIFGN